MKFKLSGFSKEKYNSNNLNTMKGASKVIINCLTANERGRGEGRWVLSPIPNINILGRADDIGTARFALMDSKNEKSFSVIIYGGTQRSPRCTCAVYYKDNLCEHILAISTFKNKELPRRYPETRFLLRNMEAGGLVANNPGRPRGNGPALSMH